MEPPYFKDAQFFFTERGDCEDSDRQHYHWWIYYFMSRRLVRELVNGHSVRTGLRGIAFLVAHGKAKVAEFLYHDGTRLRPVQEWIDKWDGKFNVLIVGACNDLDRKITSRHSIIIHLNCVTNMITMMRKRGGLIRVYVPNVGYVETSYYQLKKLIRMTAK